MKLMLDTHAVVWFLLRVLFGGTRFPVCGIEP